MRVKCVVLEHHANTPEFRRKLSNIVISEEYLSLSRLLQSAYHIEHCTFTAAGGAQERNKGSVRNHKGEILNCRHSISLSGSRGKYLGKSV